uniref:Uncharacterized protein n=1 Tax=Sphaerodactylus townsendi TaxID=933632 RepID=A0ACB8G8V0_9SAUR
MASVALERSCRSALPILLLCTLALLPVLTADRGMLVGGWRDRSVSDTDVQVAVAFAVEAYNRRSNSVFYCRALDVQKARSQCSSKLFKELVVELDQRRRCL